MPMGGYRVSKLFGFIFFIFIAACKGSSDDRGTSFNGGEGASPVIFNEASEKVASIDDVSLDNSLIFTAGSGNPTKTVF